ncbi:MAG: M36 family metallopeptidase, partial [Planctomycetes bacterium]|nr:M36 family metallopeptidase [Planctomycetota bacterium]
SQTANRTIFARHIDGVPVRGEFIKTLEFRDGSTMVVADPIVYSSLTRTVEFSRETAEHIALKSRSGVVDGLDLQPKGELAQAGDRVIESSRLCWFDGSLAYEVRMQVEGDGSWHEDVLVHAGTGEILEVDDLRLACCAAVDGTGDVFDPNPVQTADDHSFKDSNDSNSAIPASEYFTKTLRDLDGSGYLTGPYCSTSPTSGRAYEPSQIFQYQRKSDYFEEVMTYYHIDLFQRYLQMIGHQNANNRQQSVDVNGTSQDNSWYNTGSRIITLGTGGVDDGEDADIIIHEYGHALHDDVQGSIGSGQNGAMSEGYGDYFAASLYDDALVGEWDAVSYTSGPYHFLRRVDRNKYYPGDLVNQVHSDGEIWSSGLWDFRMAVGREIADNIIVEAMSLQSSGTRMQQAAQFLLTAEQQLYAGRYRPYLEWAMDRRGLISLGSNEVILSPQDSTPIAGNTVRLNLTAPGHGGSMYQALVSRQATVVNLGPPYNATINVGLDLLTQSLAIQGFSGTLPSSGNVTITAGQIPSGFTGVPFRFQAAIIGAGNTITAVSKPCAVREGIH